MFHFPSCQKCQLMAPALRESCWCDDECAIIEGDFTRDAARGALALTHCSREARARWALKIAGARARRDISEASVSCH